jgi:glycerol dehydrogenase-like iron-containing ADH family enzyme
LSGCDFFSAEQLSRAVWVYGERAIAGASLSCRRPSTAGAKKIRFTGHCSERDVAGLVQASGDDRAVVIGVGGGALLDTAKGWPAAWGAAGGHPDHRRHLRGVDAAVGVVQRRRSGAAF